MLELSQGGSTGALGSATSLCTDGSIHSSGTINNYINAYGWQEGMVGRTAGGEEEYDGI